MTYFSEMHFCKSYDWFYKCICLKMFQTSIWCQDTVDIKLLHKFETPLTRSFLTFLNSHHPNIKFTLEKEKDNETAFLDILIKPIIVFPQVCFGKVRQLVYIPIFTPFSYKIGLIKILIHRTYLISSSWNLFHDEIKSTKHLLGKNMYPPYLIDKQIKLFLNNKLSENDTPKENSNKENTTYHKLPYIGDISLRTKKNIVELCKSFCRKTNINFVLTPFKIGSLFSSKDKLPNALRPFVYKFTCTRCQSCCID